MEGTGKSLKHYLVGFGVGFFFCVCVSATFCSDTAFIATCNFIILCFDLILSIVFAVYIPLQIIKSIRMQSKAVLPACVPRA